MTVSYSLIFLSFAVGIFGLISAQNWREEEQIRRCPKDGPPIKFPFRFNVSRLNYSTDYPYPGFEISCSTDGWEKTILELPIGPTKFAWLYVRDIDYASQEIQVYNDPHGCLLELLLSENSTTRPIKFPFQFRYDRKKKYKSYSLLNCSSVSTNSFCNIELVPSNVEMDRFSDDGCPKMYDTESFPDDIYKVMTSWPSKDTNYVSLTWSEPDCRSCEANHKGCRLKKDHDRNGAKGDEIECFDLSKQRKGKSTISTVISSTLFPILVSLLFGSIVVAASFYVYTLYKDDRENRLRIEKFLKDYIALKPARYTYADIKKITNHFEDKLGQGAYGTVFKGKLSSDVLVAVKILNNFKGNGDDFINEMATIGQIHHVNVVRLVGYCAEGFRRALVYEFLPNDSLDKYISSIALTGTRNRRSLSWETLQDIALGIAKGIEYLHQGCDQRILHFDIKPHNILLDQNFKPKIADFGLAKLCSKDQSIVSMTTARGTIGYIAPEVFSKNFGIVSYKSDVYSFGMLLLEMVGGRRNTSVTEENTEEIYYPEWIYNVLEDGDQDLRIQIDEEGDTKIAKKLAIVGLWCIQWHPVGRPSMKAVVQMLEGVEELTMPPNPFASTSQSRTTSKMPATHMNLELETILE